MGPAKYLSKCKESPDSRQRVKGEPTVIFFGDQCIISGQAIFRGYM